jgi:membrane protease YdiL (CAAX protease family)
MTLPLAAALFYFVIFSEHAFARVIYAGTKLFTVVWPLAAVLLVLRTGLPRLELRDRRHLRALPLGLVTGVLIAGATFALVATPVGAMAEASAADIRRKAEELGILEHYWSFAIFLSVLHSLIEEYYWRWFVFGHLRRATGRWTAHAAAAAAFASHHVVITTQFFPVAWGFLFGALVGAGGLVWSLMLERQRTLSGIWLSHMLTDLGILTVGHKLIFGSWL